MSGTETCPKCGHTRSASETAPDGQCPACGIWYAKYAAYLQRQSEKPQKPSPKAELPAPVARSEEAPSISSYVPKFDIGLTDKAKDFGRLLAWIYAGLFTFAGLFVLINGDLKGLLPLASGLAAMPIFWRYGSLITNRVPGAVVSLSVSALLFLIMFGLGKIQENQEARLNAERMAVQEERHAKAQLILKERQEAERLKLVEAFNEKKPALYADVSDYLKERMYANILATLGPWRKIGPHEFLDIEQQAIAGFKKAVESGEPAAYSIVPVDAYPELKSAIAKGAANQCQHELQCATDKHRVSVQVECADAIERQVPSMEWTGRFKFPKFRWKADNGVMAVGKAITYIGDAATGQNAFGVKLGMVYECDFDLRTERVIEVRTRVGRLSR